MNPLLQPLVDRLANDFNLPYHGQHLIAAYDDEELNLLDKDKNCLMTVWYNQSELPVYELRRDSFYFGDDFTESYCIADYEEDSELYNQMLDLNKQVQEFIQSEYKEG